MSCYSSRRGVRNKHCNMVRNSYALVSLQLGERKQKVCSLVSPGVRHTSFSLRCRLRISDIPTIYSFVLRRVRKMSSICPSASTEKLILHCMAFCVTSPRFYLTIFFLGCKANARVILAKTGHGPHASKIVLLLYVLLFCIVLCIVCV